MRKLYNKTPTAIFYREAWRAEKNVIEHFGMVGSTGKTKKHRFDPALSEEENILQVLQPAIEAGMKPIPPEEHATLTVEYLSSGDSASDLAKRHEIEKVLDEILGWRGLGHCDGGSIGAGTFEIACMVVDFVAAKQTIEYRLHLAGYGNFNRIYG